MRSSRNSDSQFVPHPRYGERPRFTGLNPETDDGGAVHFHWRSSVDCRIANTAIMADLSRQTSAIIPVTHYFDLKRECRDCHRPFIFFAAEQKYWYEELGFELDSDCVRCVPCRKKHQDIGHKRVRYEELFHVANRTVSERLELAECCLSLIEASVFSQRQTERVRMLLKDMSAETNESVQVACQALWGRLLVLEAATPAAGVSRTQS